MKNYLFLWVVMTVSASFLHAGGKIGNVPGFSTKPLNSDLPLKKNPPKHSSTHTPYQNVHQMKKEQKKAENIFNNNDKHPIIVATYVLRI